MKARLRIIVAASVGLLLAGTPALAQDTAALAQNAVIGPPQLQNFSLNGTVTRPAPAPTEIEPPARQQPTAQAAETRRQETSSAAPERAITERREQPQRVTEPTTTAEPSLAELPAPTPAATAADIEPSLDAPTAAAAAVADSPSGGFSILPWLLAALVLGGAAAWLFLRQRPRESYAGVGEIDRFEAQPEPAAPKAAPKPASAAPAPAPAPDAPAGVVSTRLRPWLEIEFTPLRAVVDEQKAAIAFELSVFNSGSVPARDVLLEASLFNAGPMQDQQIQLFFDNPVAKGDRVPVIPPLRRMSVETAVFLAREQVRPIEIEGRFLFVPLIGFNVLYAWGRGEGQTSASYLVGKVTGGEKLAPFRLDAGPRVFRNLAAREHELRLRK